MTRVLVLYYSGWGHVEAMAEGARRLAVVVVGVPYSLGDMTRMDEITGGTPYGATALAGGDGRRPVSDNALEGASLQEK